MNFDFSADEKLVADQTARFLGDHCGSDVVRRVLDGDAEFAADVWKGMADMGLTATTIPETYGGANAVCVVGVLRDRSAAAVWD